MAQRDDQSHDRGTDFSVFAEPPEKTNISLAVERLTQWREANRKAIRQANEELAEHGLWSDGLRVF